MWPWYGDLISDPKNDDKDAPMLDIKLTFTGNLKKLEKINIYQLVVENKK